VTPDLYAILGVSPSAEPAVIRAAYLALMRKYHPDRNPSAAAAERSRAVIAAFKVLGDFERRSQYDWDRRRAREAEAALTDRPRRKAGAGAIAAVTIGLAAVGIWTLRPSSPPAPDVATSATVRPAQEARQAQASPPVERRHAQVAAPEGEKSEPRRSAAFVASAPEPVRVASIEPKPPASKAERSRPALRPLPERQEAPRVAVAQVKRPAPKLSSASAKGATTDLASLDQFVMNFYGQSWRFGDAPKRAALEQSRSSFVVKRGSCLADACKRQAYLKLMREVSEIVESGQAKAR
jgi:curved DNA-binding protein CbpA